VFLNFGIDLSLLTGIIGLSIAVACAATLHPAGITINDARDAAIALRPLAGSTVWYLFWFLRDGAISPSHGNWVLRDCSLAVLFAISHSVMLVPRTRKYLTNWISQPFYDSTFCVVTCVCLLLLFFG